MKKKLLLVGTLILALTGCSVKSDKIRFGAAALGGTYREFAESFAEIVGDTNEDYAMEVKTTAGSAANIRLLSDDYIQLAIAQNDMITDAYNGSGSFEGKKYQGYRAIAGLYTEACQIVVRADSQIYTVDDLQGKKVSIGEEESGTEQNAEQILAAYGLSDKLVEEENLDYTSAAKGLEEGKIDAFFCTSGTPTTVISELSKECEIRLVSLDEKGIDKLKNSYGYYMNCEIPEGSYTGQTEKVTTVGVKAVLLASDDLPEDTVKDMTKILFENKQKIQYTLPSDIALDEKTATEGIGIPFHKGAAAYYQEQGISVETEKKSK